MGKQFGRESAWHNALVSHLIDEAAVGESSVDPKLSRFSRPAAQADRLVRVVDNPDSELFAMEPANLFFEQSTELEETFAAIRALPLQAQNHSVQGRLSAATALLRELEQPTSRVLPLQEGRDESMILKRIEQNLIAVSK